MSTNTANFAPASSRHTPTANRSPHDYDDIIDTVYPFVDRQRSQHQRIDPDTRAAEFAPFAALTGYHETIGNVEDDNLADADTDHFESSEIEDYSAN